MLSSGLICMRWIDERCVAIAECNFSATKIDRLKQNTFINSTVSPYHLIFNSFWIDLINNHKLNVLYIEISGNCLCIEMNIWEYHAKNQIVAVPIGMWRLRTFIVHHYHLHLSLVGSQIYIF